MERGQGGGAAERGSLLVTLSPNCSFDSHRQSEGEAIHSAKVVPRVNGLCSVSHTQTIIEDISPVCRTNTFRTLASISKTWSRRRNKRNKDHRLLGTVLWFHELSGTKPILHRITLSVSSPKPSLSVERQNWSWMSLNAVLSVGQTEATPAERRNNLVCYNILRVICPLSNSWRRARSKIVRLYSVHADFSEWLFQEVARWRTTCLWIAAQRGTPGVVGYALMHRSCW